MTTSELEQRMSGMMHHEVTITKNDGSVVKGYCEPWSTTTLFIVPLDNPQGKAIEVAIVDVKTIEPKDWTASA